MSLLVYNKSGSDVILAGTGVTVPASTLPPLPGPPVNVSAELEGLTGGQFAAIEVQRAAVPLEFVWVGLPLYATTGLEVTDVYGDNAIPITSADGSISINEKDIVVSFGSGSPLDVDVYAEDTGTSTESARVDHVHKIGDSTLSSIYAAVYGTLFSDGSDGDANLDGTNTVSWATKVGSVYTVTRVTQLNNLWIRSGVTLKTANFHGPYGRGTLTVDSGGIISNDGNTAVGSAAGVTTAAGTFIAIPGGVAGGTGAGSNGSASTGAYGPVTGRYSGGQGGNTGATLGGTGGSVTQLAATRGSIRAGVPMLAGGMPWTQLGTANVTHGSSGGAGAGDGTNAGGGGGCPGGAMHLGWGKIVNNGTISTSGGGGGAGLLGNASGGGGGGGGTGEYICGEFIGNLPVANGGAGGASAGTGSPGNTGLPGHVILQIPMVLGA